MVCRPGHEKNPLEKMRHSCAHVMADAVQQLFPDAKITIGPVIEEGFFYDFDYPQGFTPDDLKKIEKKMEEIVKKGSPFESSSMTKEEAKKYFQKRGEPYKIEIIDGIPDATVTFYKHGDFTDLCKGPHVGNTKEIKAFKLLKVSGAYWRGDEKNPMLQRIYGTCFTDKKELKEYLDRLAEAEKRDHRKLGKELELFDIDPMIGSGLVLWHPKGAQLRMTVEHFLQAMLTKHHYVFVNTPHIGRSTLWETSGHLEFFKENMYAPMEVEGQTYYLKPMNCPFHISIYRSKKRSYRELPIRMAEFGTVYRFERSGVLHGLTRVRGFTQDDAHIFCTPDQAKEEIRACLKFCFDVLKSFGLTSFEAFVSTRPEKVVGAEADWERATEALKSACEAEKIPYEIDEGGGAFYGPKIDLKLKDAIGRTWQLTTIQFDFNLPERFDLSFQGSDGKDHRPYMIHRALLGSFERFLGILIEHYAGAFPVWLAPVQVCVINIGESQEAFVRKVTADLQEAGFRAEADVRNEKLGYKIRQAQLQKIPYMLVVGDKELESGKVAVRSRTDGDLGVLSLEDFMAKLKEETKLFH